MRSSLTVSGAGALLLVLLAVACAGRDDPARLSGLSDTRTMISGSVPAGTTHVIGVVVPKNTTGHDVIFEGLEPGEPGRAAGLELHYLVVRPHQSGCRVGSAHGWPPSGCGGRTLPINGFRFPDGASSALILVGARSGQTGHWIIPEFRLTYRIGDRHYTTTYTEGMDVRMTPASTKFIFFRTPSHNIGCAFQTLDLQLRCDIRSGLKPPPPKPKGCPNDWTFGYQMWPAGRARTVCAGDTVISRSARVIGYGGRWRGGPFACKSSASGLRCRNRSGHAFVLSRQHSYRF